jgi:hypothetical protein
MTLIELHNFINRGRKGWIPSFMQFATNILHIQTRKTFMRGLAILVLLNI